MATDQKLYSQRGPFDTYIGLERDMLTSIFRDGYSANPRLYYLIDHLKRLAAECGFEDNPCLIALIKALCAFRFSLTAVINGDKGTHRARKTLECLPVVKDCLPAVGT